MEVFLVFAAVLIVIGLIWLYVSWDAKRTIAKRIKDRQREDALREEVLRSWKKNQEELRQTIKPAVKVQPIPVPPSKPHYGKPAGVQPDKPWPRHDETRHHHYHQDTSSPLADVVGMAVVAELVEDLVEDRVEQAAQEVFQPAVGSFGGGGSSGSWEEPVRSSYSEPSYSSGSDFGSSSSYDSGSSSSSSSSSDY